MAINSQTQTFLNKSRQTGPEYYRHLTDEHLYKFLDTKGRVPDSALWPEMATPKPKTEPTNSTNSKNLGFFARSADWWINEDSYDWMKAGYTRSLTGTSEQLATGEARYDVDEEEFTVLQDIGASLVSFFMPLDILTLGVGGKIGGFAGKQAIKSGLFGGALKEAGKKAVKTGAVSTKEFLKDKGVAKLLTNSKLKTALLGGVRQAPALGLYEAAVEGVQSSLHGENFFKGAAKGAFHGGVMGFVTGAVGGGMGAKQAEILSRGTKKGNALGKMDKLRAYGLYGMPGQISAEASIFSTSELGQRIISGEDIDSEEILKTFARNVGLFTALKTIGKVQNKFWQDTAEVFNELDKASKAKKDPQKIDEALENTNKIFKDKHGEPSQEIINEQSKVTVKDTAKRQYLKDLIKDINEVIKLKESGDPSKLDGLEVSRINRSLAGIIEYLKGADKTPYREQLLKKAEAEKEKMKKEFDGYLKDPHKIVEEEIVKEEIVIEEKEVVKKPKLEDMSDVELLDEASSLTGRSQSDLKKDFKSPIAGVSPEGKPIDVISRERLSNYIKQKREDKAITDLGPKIPSPKEHYESMTDKEIPDNVREKVVKITNKLESDKLVHDKEGEGPLNESYYDIQEIGIKKFAQPSRQVETGGAAGTGKLIKTSRDIAYLDVYNKFAKYLAKQGRSLRDATKEDVAGFIALEPKGTRDALATLYRRLKSRGVLKEADLIADVDKISKMREVAAPVDKGLRIERIDTETGEVRYIQSKTELIKEAPFSSRLKELFKKIIGKIKVTKEAGDTIFRDINDNALTATPVKNLIKRFFGGTFKQGDLRKALSQYVARAYGENSKEWQTINAMGLGHKTAKLKEAYIKDINLKDQFKELQKEFMDLILSKDVLSKDFTIPFTKGGINIKQLRDGMSKLLSHQGEIQIGHTKVSKDMVEAYFRYMIETSPRPGEAVPQKAVDIVYKPTESIFDLKKETPKKVPETKRQVKVLRDKLDTGLEVQESQKKYFESLPGYKKLSIFLGKKLKKYEGEKTLGQIRGHLIKIAEGKVKKDTIPHEISHYAIDVLKEFGTPKDKALIKRASQMFGKNVKRKKGWSKERWEYEKEHEAIKIIGQQVAGQLTNKTLISKVKNWIKLFNARLKDMIGVGSKEDIAFILSRKVYKGNIPTGRKIENFINTMKTHHMTYKENPKAAGAAYGEGKRQENDILKNPKTYGFNSKSEAESYLNASRKEFDIPLRGVGKLADMNLGSIREWSEKLFSIRGEKQKQETKLEKLNKEYNIFPEQGRKIAKALGSIDGNIKNLTADNKIAYENIVKNHGNKEPVIPTASDHIAGLNEKLTYQQKLARTILPFYEWMGQRGPLGQKIKNKVIYYDIYATQLRGKGSTALKLIDEALKPRYGNRYKKLVYLFDSVRAEKYFNDIDKNPLFSGIVKQKTLAKEKKFYEQSKIEGTPEYRAKQFWTSYRKKMWKILKTETKKVNNEVEYAEFEKHFNEMFVHDYFVRRLTRAAYKHFFSSGGIDKIVEKKFKKAVEFKARKEALKKYPKKGEEYNQHYDILRKKYTKDENLKAKVQLDVFHFLKQDNREIKNTHLFERGELIDEFIEIEKLNGQKKIIRTYETHEKATIEPYIMTMSNHIAAIRHFPDFTGMGGKFKTGSTPADLIKLAGKDEFIKSYAIKGIENLLGVGEGNPLFREGHTALSFFANLSASIGLSSPTSGIKNSLIGLPRIAAHFGYINTAKGIGKLFNINTWKEAREKGVLEYATKTLELGQTPGGVMQKLFKFNLMTVTENINRIVAVEAGRLYYQHQVGVLRGESGIFGGTKKNARRLMKDMWQFSEKDRDFIEKGDFTTKEGQAKFKELLLHAEHLSHIATQGGTSVGRLPLWASGSVGRPLTLFQRMAYSTTHDSVRNIYQPAIKNGNFAPLARALLGHYFSGIALYGMYKWLFDTEPPKSSSEGLDKAGMYLWRSEFLGLFGDAISPYDRGMFQSLTQPVVARNLMEGGKELHKFLSGGQSFSRFINNTGSKTVVLWNQYETMTKTTASKQYSDAKIINNWERQYRIQRDMSTTPRDDWSERTPYFKDLKEALYWGSDEKIAKRFFAAYDYIVTDLEKQERYFGGKTTPMKKHKLAISSIRSSLNHMNPANISDVTGRGIIVSKKADFLKWVKEKFGQKGLDKIKKSEKDYQYSRRYLNKVVNKKSLWEKYSVHASLNFKYE